MEQPTDEELEEMFEDWKREAAEREEQQIKAGAERGGL